MGIDTQDPSMEEIIWEEVCATTQHVPSATTEERLCSYLNNFRLKIPGSSSTIPSDHWFIDGNPSDDSFKQKLKEFNSKWKLVKDENDKEKIDKLLAQGYSRKFLFQTKQQFQDDISLAIESSGVNKATFLALIDSLHRYQPTDTLKVKELLLPVYIKLREMGYTAQDLCS